MYLKTTIYVKNNLIIWSETWKLSCRKLRQTLSFTCKLQRQFKSNLLECNRRNCVALSSRFIWHQINESLKSQQLTIFWKKSSYGKISTYHLSNCRMLPVIVLKIKINEWIGGGRKSRGDRFELWILISQSQFVAQIIRIFITDNQLDPYF